MELDNAIKLGKICQRIKSQVKTYLDNYVESVISIISIVKYIENTINNTDYLNTNNNYNPVAFPVGVSVNNVCAHDTCISDSDNRIFNLETDLIKIDFGVQKDGVIIDNAFSYTRNNDYDKLVLASKHMVQTVIETITADKKIIDIQKVAEEALNSFNNSNDTNYIAISNLAGHQIGNYQIHADETQLIYPNCIVNKNDFYRIKGDSLYAIEFFVSNGINQFPGMESSNNTHFMVSKGKLPKLTKMKIHNSEFNSIRNIIVKHFGTLAFCQRFITKWINLDIDTINETLDYFFSLGIISKYPPVIDSENCVVSQHEETIYIPENQNIKPLVLS